MVKRAGRAPGGLRWRNAAPVTPLRAHHDAEDGTSLMGSSHANATSCRQVFWQVPNARAKWHMLIGGAVPDGGPAPYAPAKETEAAGALPSATPSRTVIQRLGRRYGSSL